MTLMNKGVSQDAIHAVMKQAARLYKAGKYRKAQEVLLRYRGHELVDKALAQLQPKLATGTINWLNIALAIGIIVIVGIVGGIIGYTIGNQEAVIPVDIDLGELRDTFVEVCVAETDLSPGDCGPLVDAAWLWYRADTLDCLSYYIEVSSYTGLELLQCVGDLLNKLE